MPASLFGSPNFIHKDLINKLLIKWSTKIAIGEQTRPMHLQFTKNVHFTRLIKTAQKLREFNFRRMQDGADHIFHVDVADDRGNRIVFKLRREGNRWQFISQETLPNWILNTEDVLNEFIAEEGY